MVSPVRITPGPRREVGTRRAHDPFTSYPTKRASWPCPGNHRLPATGAVMESGSYGLAASRRPTPTTFQGRFNGTCALPRNYVPNAGTNEFRNSGPGGTRGAVPPPSQEASATTAEPRRTSAARIGELRLRGTKTRWHSAQGRGLAATLAGLTSPRLPPEYGTGRDTLQAGQAAAGNRNGLGQGPVLHPLPQGGRPRRPGVHRRRGSRPPGRPAGRAGPPGPRGRAGRRKSLLGGGGSPGRLVG
jgi:hypothetical protein